jgi:F0F1-type ATP synthase membrane subunit b/b'
MSELIYPFINLIILITVLTIYLRKPLSAFVGDRHATIRDELARVRGLLQQAQTSYDEFTGKLKAMGAEVEDLRKQARQDGASAKSRIAAEAQKLSATIVSDSRATAQGLYAQLKHDLFIEIGNKIVDRTEALLKERLTGDDRARIRNEFSTQVEKAQ